MKVEKLKQKLKLANERIKQIEADPYVKNVVMSDVVVTDKIAKVFVTVGFKSGTAYEGQLDLREPKVEKVKAKKAKVEKSLTYKCEHCGGYHRRKTAKVEKPKSKLLKQYEQETKEFKQFQKAMAILKQMGFSV